MTSDVVVIGGGLIGLVCAWRAARAGFTVTVVDDSPGTGASHVAAGMLAPVTEAAYGEEDYLALTIAAARRWPAFASELEQAASTPLGYRTEGTLLVGFDADDMAVLDELHRFQQELGLEVSRLRSRECRSREPLLSPRVRGGLAANEDHRVEPRRVVAALRTAATAAGVDLHASRARALEHDDERVRAVVTATGERLPATSVVLAAGWASSTLAGLPAHAVPPLRPVKGQLLILRARGDDTVPGTTVRGVVQGRSIYLVPREGGHVVVGATQEERGADTAVTAGGVRELLDDAARIVPGVDEYELVETIAGLRPATPDNRPLIGASSLDGLLLATGHFRNGVLLAPVTADAIVAELRGEHPDPVLVSADPRRTAATAHTAPGAAASTRSVT